jgi:hypothetical protein
MYICDPFGGADRVAFEEQRKTQNRFFKRHTHLAKWLLVFFGECAPALLTAKAL